MTDTGLYAMTVSLVKIYKKSQKQKRQKQNSDQPKFSVFCHLFESVLSSMFYSCLEQFCFQPSSFIGSIAIIIC